MTNGTCKQLGPSTCHSAAKLAPAHLTVELAGFLPDEQVVQAVRQLAAGGIRTRSGGDQTRPPAGNFQQPPLSSWHNTCQPPTLASAPLSASLTPD